MAAFWVVVLLATLSAGASITSDNASASLATPSPTTLDRPSSILPPAEPIAIPSVTVEPAVPNHRHSSHGHSSHRPDLRLKQRVPQSGLGHDGAPPEAGNSKHKRSVNPSPTTTTMTSTSSATSSTPTDDAPSSPLPSPFDNAPASAFQGSGSSKSCPNFMSNLLTSPTFRSCYPFSMLLQTSTALFQAEKTLLGIVTVLEATCQADSASCTPFFNAAAGNLTSAQNCQQEISSNQTMVVEAYNGLEAYQVMYSATCLQDPDTNQYCFASAVTNITSPSDSYLYFLPYGLSLPAGSTLSCNWCTQQTMGIYRSASVNRSQLISRTYASAASQLNALCGSNFVNATLPPSSSAALLSVPTYALTFTTLCVVFSVLASML